MAFGIVARLTSGVDTHVLWDALQRTNPGIILLAVASHWAVVLAKAVRLRRLLGSDSRRSFGYIWRSLMAAYGATILVPGRWTEIVLGGLLMQGGGPPVAVVAGAIAADKLFSVLNFLLIVAPLPFLLKLPPSLSDTLERVVVVGVLCSVALVAFLATDLWRRVVAKWKALSQAMRVADALRSWRTLCFCLATVVAERVLDCLAVGLCLSAAHVSVPWPAILLVLAAQSLAFIFSIGPAHAGTLELASMAPLLVVGVEKEPALLFALIFRVVHLLSVGAAVLFAIPMLGRREAAAPPAPEAVQG